MSKLEAVFSLQRLPCADVLVGIRMVFYGQLSGQRWNTLGLLYESGFQQGQGHGINTASFLKVALIY